MPVRTYISFIVVAMFCASNSAYAINYYVATTGSDAAAGGTATPWLTIQKAANTVIAGDTVIVRSGTYTGLVVETTNGTSGAHITYRSEVKWGAKIQPTGSPPSPWTIWMSDGDYTDIDGFDIDGSICTTCRTGIWMTGSFDTTKNSRVRNIGQNAPCDSNGGAGIGSDMSDGGVFNDTIGNVVVDIGPPAGCPQNHGLYYSSSGAIKNNLVGKTSGWGIHLWHGCGNVKIVNNTVFGSDFRGGIVLGGVEFYGSCTILDNVQVRNNIVYDNKVGVDYSGNVGSNFQFTNNLVFGNADWDLIGHTPSGSTVSGTVTANPQFVNYQQNGTGDYHLSSSSPAINAGIATDAPPNDLDLVSRPQGAAFDIGAYEFVSGADTTPPTVSITAPSNGATVAGSVVAVSANAADNIGVVGVQFKLDGANLGSEDTSSPYSVTWNTTTASEGSHALTAVARDAATNSTTSSTINVTVDNVVAPVGLRYSLALRDAQVNTIEPRVGPNPVLRLCGGSIPASVSASDGGTAYATIQLPSDWATSASAGVISKTSTPWQGVVTVSGSPTHYRIYAQDGTTPHIQGSLSLTSGSGVMKIPSLSLVAGKQIQINSYTITAGNDVLVPPLAPNRLQFSTAIGNDKLNSIESVVGTSAILKIITGTIPATVAAADPGVTVATMQLPADWMGAASGGVISKLGTWSDASADATGTATHARLYQSNGTTPHAQFDVTGTGGAGIIKLSASTNVVAADTVTISTFSLNAGNQ